MKPLNLKETALKEEMKERCLNKGLYIDENAKAKFEMLCHLEDFEVQYWKLQQENKELKETIDKVNVFLNNHDKNAGKLYYKYNNKYLLSEIKEDIRNILKEVE